MEPQAEIVTTVAVALIAATAAGYLVAWIRLPTIVGYMLAGVALSPFTPGFSADRDVAGQLAESGVILLMFLEVPSTALRTSLRGASGSASESAVHVVSLMWPSTEDGKVKPPARGAPGVAMKVRCVGCAGWNVVGSG